MNERLGKEIEHNGVTTEALQSQEVAGIAKPTTETGGEASTANIEKIEQESAKLEQNLQAFQSLLQELSPNESEYIHSALESSADGKSLLGKIQEKTHALIHSYDHSKDHLSTHYDPKVVKVVGSVGKVLGGFAGFVGGHGVMSAPGSVVGSKVGGYLMLKAFKELTKYLPEEMHDKLLHPDKLEEKKKSSAEMAVTIEQVADEKENIMSELGELCNEFNSLTPEEQAKLPEVVAARQEEIMATTTKIKTAYEKYQHAFKNFEKKHPIVATGTEVAIHMAIAPVLHGLELGEAAIHAIEVIASTGGAEKFTNHLFNVMHHVRDSIKNGVESMKKFIPNAGARLEVPPIQ